MSCLQTGKKSEPAFPREDNVLCAQRGREARQRERGSAVPGAPKAQQTPDLRFSRCPALTTNPVLPLGCHDLYL